MSYFARVNLSLTRRSPTGRNAQMNRSGPNGRSSGAFPPGIYAESPKGSASAMLERVKPSHLAPHWISWESLALTVSKLPTDVNTYTVWKSFSACGTVDFVELFENAKGNRVGRARIRFRPPPKESFWMDGQHVLELDDGQRIVILVRVETFRRKREVPSPVDPKIMYPLTAEAVGRSLDVGCRFGEQSMVIMRTINASFQDYVRFVTDLYRREINIYFQMVKMESSLADDAPQIIHSYRIRVPFAHLSHIKRTSDGEEISFIFSLDYPPSYYRKLQDPSTTFSDSDNMWRSDDTWYRQTDIVHNPQDLVHSKTSLKKAHPIINIGRWTTFRLTFHLTDENNTQNLETLSKILRDFNIEILDAPDFEITKQPPTADIAWRWIDPPTHASKWTSPLEDLADNEYKHISYTVRYQLEVCISHGLLSEYTITKEFAERLQSLGEDDARDLLEHVSREKAVYHDPMKIFDIEFFSGVTGRKIPKNCCYMRSATVTPSTIYFHTPTVDTSNRVLRYYIEHADRFLRVRFADEKYEGRINSSYNNCMDELFTRVKRTMTNGITVGDRHYEFLAFGNSQFREHGAYFFASLPTLTAANIRAWMGHFSDIKIVAKHAARLGQCFSATKAVTGCPVIVQEIDEIERNGYIFSDGVGRISNFLAQMIRTELNIQTPSDEPPSVFQFRLGGCKGILTVSPEAQHREVHIRKSQYKFAAVHNGLEVIRHSKFAGAHLNRQLIMVLSALGVTDEIFLKKLHLVLEDMQDAMTNESKAITLLQKRVDPNQMTFLLAHMVNDGFQASCEPFVKSLLELWRAWDIKYLKEKAKIHIEKGACLLGCIDETATLKGYYEKERPASDATIEERLDNLPEIFVQVFDTEEETKYKIIEGPCILARNPSLHPGDIRVVRAVNVPALHHLKDVIVFPQTGDRDVSSTCSGGDLDGDDYIVIWDPDLIPLPKDWFCEPMDYTASNAQSLTRDVTVNDITSFFVTYMKNDHLPQIAHSHLAFADYVEDGVNDERCMQLAQLHSAAVDYNKTGIPANMSRDLIPRKWPHFMEKNHKPKEAQYYSRKILGQIYDIVERVEFRPKLEAPFDKRILNSHIPVSDDLIQIAKKMKVLYDADMRRIMAQHEVKTEFEVWSTFALGHANMTKDYRFHEELGQISSGLRNRFLMMCHDEAGGHDFQHLAPLAIAMYRVTAEEVAEALREEKISKESGGSAGPRKERKYPGDEQLPLISFPWVLQPVLGKVANGHFDNRGMMGGASKLATWSSAAYEQSKIRRANGVCDGPHDIETAGGIQHAGEVLELFQENLCFDPFEGLGDAFDQPASPDNKQVAEQVDEQKTSTEPEGITPLLDEQHSDSLIELDDEIFTPVTTYTIQSTSGRGSVPIEEQSSLLDLSDDNIQVWFPKHDSAEPKLQTTLLELDDDQENQPPPEKDNLVPLLPLFLDALPEVDQTIKDEEIEMMEEDDVDQSVVKQLETLLNL
ncbi:RNA-directed RNA polymerase Rdp1 [Microsporum canis CBS 113480]|uniref:RNA-dependent RNA polymerase n=1 Tax=Arthroderma otae (strain ATCC MYA-4605 / CBS 113480) TaxID=554155 RepID=C5FZE0_ARTOC|nr:RNA-directed RNA polymerase Rdp1 [Microsporum canis CBS 113480]EEQ35243.1 RNA-directed RNA polymerase Rdp1 [Microsporum canis CBS 113480]